MSAINLSVYQSRLRDAWEDVLNEASDTNWALFGYEGQTYNLNLVSKGSGGLEELQKEFQESAIMYAFCRVVIPPSGIKRNILINWQGEGAPVVRKGCCANHLPDVQRFFKGLQLILNARSDEEVEPAAIFEKLEKCFAAAAIQRTSNESSGGSSASDSPSSRSAGPSSVYQRVQPAQDVTSISEREKFWQQQQEEEKRRAREEKKVLTEKRRKEKEDLIAREMEAAKAREQKYRDESKPSNTNAAVKRKPVAPVKKLDISMWEKQIKENGVKDGQPPTQTTPEPIKSIDNKRSVKEARAFFENRKEQENGVLPDVVPSGGRTSAGSTATPGKITVPKFESKPVQKSFVPAGKTPGAVAPNASNDTQTYLKKSEQQEALPPTTNEQPKQQQQQQQPQQQATPKELPYTKNLLNEDRRNSIDAGGNDEEQDWEEEPLEEPPSKIPDPLVDAMLEQGLLVAPPENTSSQNTISADPPSTAKDHTDPIAQADSHTGQLTGPIDKGQCARALFDYEAADDTEISFDPDDIITNIDQIDEGWWQGVAPDGTFGLFPANYVELM